MIKVVNSMHNSVECAKFIGRDHLQSCRSSAGTIRDTLRDLGPSNRAAGPGVRSACENLVAAVGAAKNDHGEDKDVWDKLDTACDAAQLALDQEPDGAELVKALQGVLDFYCPNRCGFEDHTPQCVAARAALAKWKGGVK